MYIKYRLTSHFELQVPYNWSNKAIPTCAIKLKQDESGTKLHAILLRFSYTLVSFFLYIQIPLKRRF